MLLRVMLLIATFTVAVRPSLPDWIAWSDSPEFQERAQGFFSFMDADDEDDGMEPGYVVVGGDHLLCPDGATVGFWAVPDGPHRSEPGAPRHRLFLEQLFRPPRA